MEFQATNAVRFSVGAKFKTEYEFITGIRRSKPVFTLDMGVYKTWKPPWLLERFSTRSKLVLSGWSNYRYPASLHAFERSNGLLQGAFKFALSIPIRETQISLTPFVSIKAKTDNKGRIYNNFVEPGLGIDLRIPFKNGGSIAIGAKAVHQWRFGNGTTKSGVVGYTAWYKKF